MSIERIRKALDRHSLAKDRLINRAIEYAVCARLHKKNELIAHELGKSKARLLATSRAFERTLVKLPKLPGEA